MQALSRTRRNISRAGFRNIQPYGWSVILPSAACGVTSTSWSCVVPLTQARRFFRARSSSGDGAKPQDGSAADAEKQHEEQQAADATSESKKAEGGKGKDDTQEPEGPGGIRGFIEHIKRDSVEFPDIYNSANAINFVLFTIFCLCSTGSNVEGEWWLDQFGIDAAFRPLAWFLHSFVMNNFLSMTFAMMLLHTMCHSVLPTIGSRGLFLYCAIISVASGVLMWAGNYAAGYTKEKQFGPWDIVAGLFVMQFLHQGFLPWQILNSFNGWVRYACWVGAVCILYYDPQPTVLGALLGFALCKGHPKFRVTPGPGAAA